MPRSEPADFARGRRKHQTVGRPNPVRPFSAKSFNVSETVRGLEIRTVPRSIDFIVVVVVVCPRPEHVDGGEREDIAGDTVGRGRSETSEKGRGGHSDSAGPFRFRDGRGNRETGGRRGSGDRRTFEHVPLLR